MFERKLVLPAVVFLIASVFGGTISAQSINDDLKPPGETTKIKPATKNSVKTPKKISRPRQSAAKTGGSTGRTTKISGGNNNFVSETPDQIINRYMNFRQSAGVTLRDWKSVIAQTAKTLQDNPNHSTAKAQSLIAQGQIAYNGGSYPAAISYFKSAVQILPTSSLPHYSLGKVYLANGQAKAAEASFKEAIEQNENFALAYQGMGEALNAQGEKKKAVKFFKKATEMSVRNGSLP